MNNKLLTKSKYLIGLQCFKYLWMAVNDKENIPKPDKATQYMFDQGKLVGEYAKKLFSKGIDIPKDDFMVNIKQTKELLVKRKPLFEAGFLVEPLYSRADILNPAGKYVWDIIEVKSGTQVKDVNIHDVAFQKHCYEKAGLKIGKCYIMHINNKYVKKREINPNGLFIKEDITAEVDEAIEGIQERIKNMLNIISSKKCPEITINENCKYPYKCQLIEQCWEFLPKNCVFDLYRIGKNAFKLFDDGIVAIKDIPDDFKLNSLQQIQKQCEKTGRPYIDKKAIQQFLKTLKYPLYYLDFETINPAVPLFDGTTPYQQITFQFSLHVDNGKEVKHYDFLADGKEDPRPKLLKKLKKFLGDNGSIIVYNKVFEEARLREFAETFPKYKQWIDNVLERVIDLIIPFRAFQYYSPKQQGSCSIKDVLPALVGKGYDGLEISDGGEASLSFLDITYGDAKDKKKVRKALLEYCCLDTEGMVWMVEKLGVLVK